jgi:hypothetical protein
MHETNLNNVKLNIDSIKKGTDGYWHARGWVGSLTKDTIVTDILLDGKSLNISWEERPDVYSFYKEEMSESTGFHIMILHSDINKKLWIRINNEEPIELISLAKWATAISGFNRTDKDVIVVDNFYADPDLVREYAMNNLEFLPSKYHKGQRSQSRYIINGTKEKLEEVLGKKITNWNNGGYANGVFQFCTADQPIVYHVDSQMYAAMVYLTPGAPPQTGTAMYRSKVTGISSFPGQESRMGDEYVDTFRGTNKEMNFYDGTQFEKIDDIGNVYNRLVIFNSSQLHAATEYFGDAIDNARFFHMFFFDIEQ